MRTERFAASGKTSMLQEPVHVDNGELRSDDTALRRAALATLAAAYAPFPVAIPFFSRCVSSKLCRNVFPSMAMKRDGAATQETMRLSA